MTAPAAAILTERGENPPTDPGRLLAARAAAVAGTLDERQWELAELAAEAQAERVPQWDAIIGVAVGRAPRTVRGWAGVADFRASQPTAPDAPFAYWAMAQKYAAKLPPDDVIALLQVALDEHASADQYAGELRDMLPDPPGPGWAAMRDKAVAALENWQAVTEDSALHDWQTKVIERARQAKETVAA